MNFIGVQNRGSEPRVPQGNRRMFLPCSAEPFSRPGCGFFSISLRGDNLDHTAWDPRSLSGNARLEEKEKIALLAFELACRIGEAE